MENSQLSQFEVDQIVSRHIGGKHVSLPTWVSVVATLQRQFVLAAKEVQSELSSGLALGTWDLDHFFEVAAESAVTSVHELAGLPIGRLSVGKFEPSPTLDLPEELDGLEVLFEANLFWEGPYRISYWLTCSVCLNSCDASHPIVKDDLLYPMMDCEKRFCTTFWEGNITVEGLSATLREVTSLFMDAHFTKHRKLSLT